LICAIMAALALVIVVHLARIQVADHGDYVDDAREQRVRTVVMADAPRGAIYDRNGHMLAGNGVRYAVEAAPAYVADPLAVAEQVAPILERPVAEIEALLEGDGLWVQLAAQVSKQAGEQIAELGLLGIYVRPTWVREYPEGDLAAHMLGFCTVEITGYYGVEGYYDTLLRPETVTWERPVDTANEQIPWAVKPFVMPDPAASLVLTIDRTMQALVEQELMRSTIEFGAQGGTIIVMDPNTFEILAMASLPSYDPNHYTDYYEWGEPPFADPAVSQQYEPGSIFKLITIAAALDSRLVWTGSTYNDTGRIEVGGREIRNSLGRVPGEQTVADIMIKSLNVGAAWLSTQMGPDVFYRYVRAFGFGSPTGVDLAGEAWGTVWLPQDVENWHDSNLGTNAFGQGLAVTPLQLATALATIANDGVRLRPRIVAQQTGPDGQVISSEPAFEARVISPETADTVTKLMVRTIEESVTNARVNGYRVAGKTGTAQIPVPGGYDPSGTIATFGGFGPLPDPQLVILIKLDRPSTSEWAFQTAATSFGRLAEQLFVLQGIPPQELAIAEAAR
jgi:cell division protein FtsI/penicillin-binding protein 2